MACCSFWATSEDNWDGYTGFIHQVLLEEYLKNHPQHQKIVSTTSVNTPIMNKCVIDMLLDLGVEREDIMLDDFGG